MRVFISAHKLSTPTVFDDNSEELELRSDFMLLPRFKPAVKRRLSVGEALVSCTCRTTINTYAARHEVLTVEVTRSFVFWDIILRSSEERGDVPLKNIR
jgi:hypothetical protein